MAEALKAGALFSGIGGFCIGFGRAGIPTAWAVEIDEYAGLTYRAFSTCARLLSRDIRQITVRGADLEPVDVLHAGFPCQSFSQAGERRGFDDPRGSLFFEIPRLLREFGDRKPKVLVLENSPFLRYGEGGAWFLQLQQEIQRAGYWFRDANCAELNAYEITSLPQQRVRLYMVAFSMQHFRSGRFDFPKEKDPRPKQLEDYIDFEGEQNEDYYLPLENRYHKMLSTRSTDGRSVYQLRKYEIRAKEPGVCPTLTANMGLGGHNVPFVWDTRGLRKLTERECLRLQGFPPDLDFPTEVPRARRYVQVGNAVTVPVAELIARRVREKMMMAADV